MHSPGAHTGPHSTLMWMRLRHPLLRVEADSNQGAWIGERSTGWISALIHLLAWALCTLHNCIQESCSAPVMTSKVLHGTLSPFPSLTSFLTLISFLSSHTGLLAFFGAPGTLLPQWYAKLFLHQETPFQRATGLLPHLLQVLTQTPSSQWGLSLTTPSKITTHPLALSHFPASFFFISVITNLFSILNVLAIYRVFLSLTRM